MHFSEAGIAASVIKNLKGCIVIVLNHLTVEIAKVRPKFGRKIYFMVNI